MDQQERPLSEVIAATLYSSEEIRPSDLVRLSDLNDAGLAQFKQGWVSAAIGQRTKLITRLASLGEDDFTLDFTRVFQFCLDDVAESVRIKALAGLELEDKYAAVRPIIKTLRADESAEVREVAARVLGKFALLAEWGELPQAAAADIFDALLEALEKPGEPASVRRRALESIAAFQQELVEDYIEDFYYSEDPRVKASAIFAMGRNCKSRWLDFLIEEMQSSNAEFRFEAARSSGEIENEDAVPGLLKLLDDEDKEVQDAAIMALGKIGGTEAKQALQKLSKSHDARIREAALSALTELEICQDLPSSSF